MRKPITWRPVWMQIRSVTHKGQPGWLLCGTDRLGRKVKIWGPDRGELVAIRWVYRNPALTTEEQDRRVDAMLLRKPFSLIA